MARSDKSTGILSNSYIPKISTKVLSKELHRLETDSLFLLVKLWIKWPITQPTLTKEHRKRGKTRARLIQDIENLLTLFKSNTSMTSVSKKKRLIDKILVEYWSNGLNILQLALIDTQCIIDKTNNFSWVSSTAKVMTGSSELIDNFNSSSSIQNNNYSSQNSGRYSEIDTKFDDFIFSLDPQSFLDTLIKNLSSLYITHIYISRHHTLPLILIRIQVFDVSDQAHIHKKKKLQNDANSVPSNNGNTNGSSNTPEISSRKPYYLAIPLSSPNIIHSDTDDLISKIIIQAVEMTLSSHLRQIRLVKNKEHPVRTLEVMHVLKGVSRFSNSLGSWIPYADGIVDINPLGDSTQHLAINPMRLTNNDDDDDDDYDHDNEDESEAEKRGEGKKVSEEERKKLRERKLIANLKFKGSALKIQSDRLYEDTRPLKRKRLGDNDQLGDQDKYNEFASVAPIQYAEYRLENKITQDPSRAPTTTRSNDGEQLPSVRLRFVGNDVFAGLHELCVVNEVVDPEKIPSWLTGSERKSTGVIKDNEFIETDYVSMLEQ